MSVSPITSFTELFARMERQYADRNAFNWMNEDGVSVSSRSYGEFTKDIRRAMSYLRVELGEVRGQHIAILAHNSYEYAVQFFAAALAGSVVIPLNYEKTRDEIAYELDHADVTALIHDGGYIEREGSISDAFSGKLLAENGFAAAEPATEPFCDLPDEALAVILFTSGTTGRSKGVMLSQKCIFSVLRSDLELSDRAQRGIGKAPEDHIAELLILPMYHVAGLNRLLIRMAGGNTLNIGSVRTFYRDLKRMPTDYVLMVPVILSAVHKDVQKGHTDKFGSLRTIVSAGAMLDPRQMQELTERGYFLMNCYGMTELFSGGTRNASQEVAHVRSIGRADTIYDCRIVDGELCFRGDGVMLGYYKEPEATAEVIDAEGWMHTGDLACIDEDGYIYLTGRKKNLIILSSGENVSPEELESYLAEIPAVIEAVVKEKNDRICAEIYCAASDRTAVREAVRARNAALPLYKQMSVIEFRDTPFERTATGKIKRGV